MEKEKRRSKYDYIRATAIMFVVLMHLCAHVKAEPFGIKWWIVSAVMLFTSTCNGLFFLLSGKFNLNLKNSNDLIRFYKKRAVSIVIPFLVCSFICFIVEKRLLGTGNDYITSLISISPTTHYWFAYELIGLIVWTPFFAVMMDGLALKGKCIMTALVLVFQTVFVFIKDVGAYPGYEVPLLGWPLFYLVGSFADDIPDKWRKWIIVLGAGGFIMSLLQMRLLPDASHGLQDLSPKYFFSVLAAYYILLNVSIPEGIEKATLFLSQYSYYIYLFHNTVIMVFFSERLDLYDYLISRTGTILFLLIVFITSIGLSFVLGMMVKKTISVVFKKIV